MLEYISGNIVEINPTYVVIDNNGLGYFINISLNAFTALQNEPKAKIFVYEVIREDAHTLFGFINKHERELFLLLISVSGVGANTARMILSSLNPAELEQVIATENVNSLKSVKGIGGKTAQRIIVDLKDKIKAPSNSLLVQNPNTNQAYQEALAALVMLGFSQQLSQKALTKLFSEQTNLTVEDAIKKALKMM